MASQYYVPEQYAGKTLAQIRNESNGAFRPDVLGGLVGIDQNAKLAAGQALTLNGGAGSSEEQFLTGNFTPYDQYQKQQSDAFSARQKQEEQGFLDALNAKVGGQETLSNASERIGGDLQLPALRESAFNLTQTLKNIPRTQETISKQVGISAPNLQKRIASEQGKLAPVAQEAISQQQFAEQELGNRLGLLVADQAKELQPFYQAQLPLLSDRLAREQTNYQQDKQNELDVLLTKISQGFQATQAELDRANQLALAERNYQNSLDTIKLSTDEAIRQFQAQTDIKNANKSNLGTVDEWEYV